MRTKEPRRRPPKHLRPATKIWWASVIRDYQLEPHHLLLLTAACESLDRAALAREAIAKDGGFFVDRHGARKPHSGLQVERDSRALFSRLLRELGLDVAPDAPRAPLGKGY